MIRVENYFETFLIIFLVLLFFYLIKSFIMTIIFASALVFLFYRPYLFFLAKTENESFSAFFVIFLVLCMVFLPTYFVLTSFVSQASNFIVGGNDFLTGGKLDSCGYLVCETISGNLEFFQYFFKKTTDRLLDSVSNSTVIIFGSIYSFFLNFFIFLLSFFFLLKDGDKFVRVLKRIIPMKTEYKNALFLKFKDVSSAVFLDTILIALVQGTLVSIGFYIFGVPSFVFWGVMASFFALIPMIGTPIIWAPSVLYLVVTGSYANAFFMFLYGAIVVGLSDNFLRPILLKKKIKVHSFLILLSIMGGIEVFGFMGIFMGPIIISFFISVLELYKLDFR